jgi:hypothetical protein
MAMGSCAASPLRCYSAAPGASPRATHPAVVVQLAKEVDRIDGAGRPIRDLGIGHLFSVRLLAL